METISTPIAAIQLNPQNREFFRVAAKWARFLAIVGFICCLLIIVFGFSFTYIMSIFQIMGTANTTPFPGFMSAFMGVIYTGFALIYLFPCLYLYRFADHMKLALTRDQQNAFDFSIRNLKSVFKYVGILSIITLCLIALEIIVFVALASSGVMSGPHA